MNILKKHIDQILFFFLISFLISDFITSISVKLYDTSYFHRYSGVIKFLFEVIMVFMILYDLKKPKKELLMLLVLTISFLIAQLLLSNKQVYLLKKNFLEGNIYFYNRYIYILVFITFIKSVQISSKVFIKFYRFFEYFMYINSIIILISLVFEIELFRSYEYSERFGFSGFFSKPNEAGFMYMIIIICNYYLWRENNKKVYLNKAVLFTIFSVFIGTKAVLLFIGLLLTKHVLFINKYQKIYRVVFVALGVLVYWFRENIIFSVFNLSPFWKKIYESNGLLYALSSKRTALFDTAMGYIVSNWDWLNYLFGGIVLKEYKTEFELVDLYLFLGTFGVTFYLYLLSFHFLKSENVYKKGLIIIVFITSFFSGGLFLNVTAVIIFYIVVNYIMVNQDLVKTSDNVLSENYQALVMQKSSKNLQITQ